MENESLFNTAAPAAQTAPVIQVAVPRPLHSVYDYQVPQGMPLPKVGARVRVPFGRTKTIGICVSDTVESPHAKLKPIIELIDTSPLFDQQLMDLAHWMTQYYHYPLGEVLSTILPGAARRGVEAVRKEEDFWQTTDLPFENERAKKQAALWHFVNLNPGISGSDLVTAGHNRTLLNKLKGGGFVERCAATNTATETPPEANPEQAQAIAAITARASDYTAFLLEGVTGSGKTEVYLRSMSPIIKAGRQALVLVPEIGLTPQTLARFQARFPRTGMMHSNLSDVERFQTWLKCQRGELDVLVGTRSSVFTPFMDLGIIIVDEEHDSSYKQQDGLRYSARDIAAKRAHEQHIPLVLGSATPSLESLHNVNLKRYQRLSLTKRAGGASLPTYNLIDMRGESHTEGISNPLLHVIRHHLTAGNQVLVFLNRRGFAPTLLCAACGWQAHCSDCDAKLTLHLKPSQLICHHCMRRFEVPRDCEHCAKPSLMPVGLGTQRSEQGLAELFPDTPIYRIDRDTTRSTQALQARFNQINQGDACIMVGTQILAKGHHFPDVTLVAVLNADSGFLSPDFRAPERTAQIIVQVAGRAGRAEKPGEVWIQTFQPDSPTLQQLITQGYNAFAQATLIERQQAGLPPAQPMAMLRADASNVRDAASFLEQLKSQLHQVNVYGPVAAPLARLANRSRYQLMLLAKSRNQLHQALAQLKPPTTPRDLRWSIDVDPYDGL